MASVLLQMESGRPNEKHLLDLAEACAEAKIRFAQGTAKQFESKSALVYTIAGLPSEMQYPETYMQKIMEHSGEGSGQDLRAHICDCFSERDFC